MSGHELILGRQRKRGCRDADSATVELTGVAWPDDPHGVAFPRELCADREMSRDMTLDQTDQAFAFPAALHGDQAMELRALRRVFDELAHDQSQFRGGIDSIESANAVAQPGKKTDGEFIHDRHSKFFLRLEVVDRQLVRHARVLGNNAQRSSFETHRRSLSRAAAMMRARVSALDGLARRVRGARSASTGFAVFRGFSAGEKKDLPVGKFSSYIIFRM